MASKEHWQFLNDGGAKTYTTAKQLWDVAAEYFKWCDDNPIQLPKKAMSGKEFGREVMITKKRPYTVIHLCLHCGIVPEYLKDMQRLNNKNNEFYHVVTSIVNIIKGQNIEMAMIDEFNPIFTSKILGLEREEAPTGGIKVEVIQLPASLGLSNSENALLEKIELEKAKRENDKEQNA